MQSKPSRKSSKPRAVVYARVSSIDQRDKGTIRSQLTNLPEFAAARGWHLVKPASAYVDDGLSGTTGADKRESLAALLADARAGLFDLVVVQGIDRLTRTDDWHERAAVFGAFQRAGVRIADASTGTIHDLDTDSGDLLVGVGAIFAAREHRAIRERTMRGRRRSLAEGKKPQGPNPYGYSYDRNTGHLLLCEHEAAVVREIYQMIQGGLSCHSAALALNRRDVPTRKRKNQAPVWDRGAIYRILTSATYRGEYVANRREKLSLAVPAIVSDAEWHKVQALLAERSSAPRTRTKRIAYASGRAICALCGGNIGIAYGAKRAGKKIRYYVCMNGQRPVDKSKRCTTKWRRVEHVDMLLWEAIADAISNRSGLLEALNATQPADLKDNAKDLEQARQRLARLDSTERGLVARFRSGLLELSLDTTLAEIANERAALRAEIAESEAVARHATPEEIVTTLDDLRQLIQATTSDERAAIVAALIPGNGQYKIVIGPDSIAATLCLLPVTFCLKDESDNRRALDWRIAA